MSTRSNHPAGQALLTRRDIVVLAAAASVTLPLGVTRGDDPKPALPNTTGTLTFSRKVPELEKHDVVVCGGGPSGVAAALSARRAGARVLLVEANGQLGGTGTSGLVSHWLASI